MTALTLVLPYYENPSMFRHQQAVWRSYPADLKARLHVIVVDDGSPTRPAADEVSPTGVASFRLFRVGVDVRWNWLFCRNLGMSKATTDWVLMTDMDHVLSEATLRSLLARTLTPTMAYRLSRVDAPALTPYKPHPNTWLLTRALFDRCGGYDERLSGFYGTDGEFHKRLATFAKIVMLPETMIRFPRTVIPDASTTTYTRKDTFDKPNVNRIIAEREGVDQWRPKRLSFPYDEVTV